jgi:hypothetical protein
MSIPDEVMDFAGLVIAIKASSGTGTEPDGDEAGTDMDTITEAESPVLMSMERKLVEHERAALKRRIEALCPGRIDRPTRDRLLADLGKVQLSMDRRAGMLKPSALEAKVAAYEELPIRQFARARLSHDGTAGIVEAAPPGGLEDTSKAAAELAKADAARLSAGRK